MRKHTALLLTFFGALVFVLPFRSDAATEATIQIDQVSASEYGVWTLFTASGTTKTSKDPGVATKGHSFTLSEFGQVTLTLVSPPGMASKISVYRGNVLKETIELPQYSFELLPNDNYRFVIQYNMSRLGSLGVTSDPGGMRFRMKGPSGKIYTGKTPHTFPKLPVGKYTVEVQSRRDCVTPAPKNSIVQYEHRNTMHVSMRCGALKEEQLDRIRPSKRSIVEQAEQREFKPRGSRK